MISRIECDELDILIYPSQDSEERNGESPSAIIVHCLDCKMEDVFNEMDKQGFSVHFVVPQTTGAELVKLMPKDFPNNVKLKYPDKVPVIQLVDTDKSAFHAGASAFAEITNFDSCSIGLAFVSQNDSNIANPISSREAKYTDKQIETGIKLTKHLMSKHSMKYDNFFAHSTIAVDRKGADPKCSDQEYGPGADFPWKKFSDNGIGVQITEKEKSYLTVSGNESDKDESSLIWAIQQKLHTLGFMGSPGKNGPRSLISVTEDLGAWNQLTQEAIKAFTLQYASDLYQEDVNLIDKNLIFRYLCVYLKKIPENINTENPPVSSTLYLTGAVVVAGAAAILGSLYYNSH